MLKSKSLTEIDSLNLNEKRNEAMRLSNSLEWEIRDLKEQVLLTNFII